MQASHCSILTIAPYRILPVKSGGHAGIALFHDYLGKICPDHLVSTRDNDEPLTFSFDMHGIFSEKPQRYIPLHKYSELIRIAKTYDATAIICEHPYMVLSAIILARRLRVPWFLHSHNIESQRFKTLGKKWWPLMNSFERMAMRSANGVFFVTQEDAAWAQQHYGLPAPKCHVTPYGTVLHQPPTGHYEAKQAMAAHEGFDASVPWLYFIGTLDYYPNTQAVSFILEEVLPRLDKAGVRYKMMIAGKGLPEHLQQQIKAMEHTVYMGFVPKLDLLLNGCDIMLNPTVTGGGIKTKAVEALGYNKIVVSTVDGAAGIKPDVCGNNLLIAPDHDWQRFTELVIQAMQQPKPTIPNSFYQMYYWGNIAKKVVDIVGAAEYR